MIFARLVRRLKTTATKFKGWTYWVLYIAYREYGIDDMEPNDPWLEWPAPYELSAVGRMRLAGWKVSEISTFFNVQPSLIIKALAADKAAAERARANKLPVFTGFPRIESRLYED